MAELRVVVHWAHRNVGFQPVADNEFIGDGEVAVDELIEAGAMNVYPLGRVAHLPARRERTAHQLSDHAVVEASVLEHDRWVVAAELEAQALQVRAAVAHDDPAGVGAAREQDLADPRVSSEDAADADGVSGHDLQDAGGQQIRQPAQDAAYGERRMVGELDDDRVAREQSRGGHEQREDHGVVPRHDDGGDAERVTALDSASEVVVELELLLVLLREPGVVAEHSDGVADLRSGLAQSLAVLTGEQGRPVAMLGVHRISRTAEETCPIRCFYGRPTREGALRCFYGA